MSEDRDERLIRELRGIRYLLGAGIVLAALVWCMHSVTQAIIGPPPSPLPTELSGLRMELQAIRAEMQRGQAPVSAVLPGPKIIGIVPPAKKMEEAAP